MTSLGITLPEPSSIVKLIVSPGEYLAPNRSATRAARNAESLSPIAWKADVFHYGAIYSQADFSSLPYAEQLFSASGTRDFEVVIRNLKHAAKTVLIYPGDHTALSEQMLRDAEGDTSRNENLGTFAANGCNGFNRLAHIVNRSHSLRRALPHFYSIDHERLM
jgi:hypothetical protein